MNTEHTLSFGTWVRAKRGEMSYRRFAQLLNVDVGTLKRTEEGKGEVMLSTAVRFCRGMDLSYTQVWKQWQGVPPVLPLSAVNNTRLPHDMLLEEDVLGCLRAVMFGNEQVRELLAAVLNQVADWNGVQGVGRTYLFHVSDIEQLLLDVPWMCFEIVFPSHPSTTLETLWQGVHDGGVVLKSEIGAAITRYREQHHISLRDWCHETQLTVNVLVALEAGNAQYIKLQDMLQMDAALGHTGLVVGLYWQQECFRQIVEHQWQTLQRYQPRSSLERVEALVALIVSAGRWMQWHYQQHPGWLALIRKTIALA